MAKFSIEVLKLAKLKKIDQNKAVGQLINQKIDLEKTNPKYVIAQLEKDTRGKVSDYSSLDAWVQEALTAMPEAVEDYKKGKINAITALIGKVMQLSKGKADASVVRKLLEKKL